MIIFIDSSFFKAYVDGKDDFHKASREISNKLVNDEVELVTSNFIIDETFTLVRVKCGLEKARDLYKTLKNLDKSLMVVRVLAIDEAEAWKWFWKPWKDLSFTDCTSFALMKRLVIKRVATFDKHYTKAGFRIIT